MGRLIEDELLMQRIVTDIPEMDVELRKKVFDIIDEMPIVCEWIPASERLPEEHDEYYVTWKYNYYDIDNKRYVGIFEFTDEEGFIPDMMLGNRGYIDVIAWMPLPEKYVQSKLQES